MDETLKESSLGLAPHCLRHPGPRQCKVARWAVVAIYLSSIRRVFEEINLFIASGECEKNAHPLRAWYPITPPPRPPNFNVGVVPGFFSGAKKTLTFATDGFST